MDMNSGLLRRKSDGWFDVDLNKSSRKSGERSYNSGLSGPKTNTGQGDIANNTGGTTPPAISVACRAATPETLGPLGDARVVNDFERVNTKQQDYNHDADSEGGISTIHPVERAVTQTVSDSTTWYGRKTTRKCDDPSEVASSILFESGNAELQRCDCDVNSEEDPDELREVAGSASSNRPLTAAPSHAATLRPLDSAVNSVANEFITENAEPQPYNRDIDSNGGSSMINPPASSAAMHTATLLLQSTEINLNNDANDDSMLLSDRTRLDLRQLAFRTPFKLLDVPLLESVGRGSPRAYMYIQWVSTDGYVRQKFSPLE